MLYALHRYKTSICHLLSNTLSFSEAWIYIYLCIFRKHLHFWTMAFCLCLQQRWAVISKTQMKNAKKAFNREQTKSDAKDKKEVSNPEFGSISGVVTKMWNGWSCLLTISWNFQLSINHKHSLLGNFFLTLHVCRTKRHWQCFYFLAPCLLHRQRTSRGERRTWRMPKRLS